MIRHSLEVSRRTLRRLRERNQIVKNGPWVLVANASISLGMFVQSVVIARLLGPESLGGFLFALAVLAPVSLLVSLGLRSVVQTSAVTSDADLRELIALRLIGSALLFALAAPLALAVGADPILWLAVGLGKAADMVTELLSGICLRERRPAPSAWPTIANQLASCLLLYIGISVYGGIVAGVAGTAIASLVAAFFIGPVVTFSSGWFRGIWWPLLSVRFTRVALRARTLAPLGVSSAVVSAGAVTPRYWLEGVGGSAAVGLFGAANAIASLPNVLYTSIAQAGMSPLAQLAHGTAQIGRSRLVWLLVALNAAIGSVALALAALVGPAIVTALYGSDFRAAGVQLVLLFLAGLIQSPVWILDCVLVIQARYRAQMLAGIFGVVAMIVACAVLVPRAGGSGAAVAVVVSSVVLLLAKLTATLQPGGSSERSGPRVGRAHV